MGDRVVKFRGKRIDNGEWVRGDLTRYSEEMSYITVDLVENEVYQVHTETVGQYTGLKDKDGVEIYEGDILRNVDNPFVDKLPFKVEWNEHYGAWFWRSLLGEVGTDHLYQHIAKDCEVIGNIYDNPELMEGEV